MLVPAYNKQLVDQQTPDKRTTHQMTAARIKLKSGVQLCVQSLQLSSKDYGKIAFLATLTF